MHKSDIKKYLQSELYTRFKHESLTELNTALNNLKSADVVMRLTGAKRLSYFSRMELGTGSLCIREWFLSKNTRTELSNICTIEVNDKVLQHFLIALYYIYDRYIVYTMCEMWLPDGFFMLEDVKEDELSYIQWILPIVEACHRPTVAIFVKEVLARIFAMCRDNRAWDIYIEILPKKSAYCDWGQSICNKYAKHSITESQKVILLQILDRILSKRENLYALEMKKIIKAL